VQPAQKKCARTRCSGVTERIAPAPIRAGPCPSVVKKMAGVADTLCSMRSLRFNISAVKNLRQLAQFADKFPIPFPVSMPLRNHPFSLTSRKSKSPMKTRFSYPFFVLVSRLLPYTHKIWNEPSACPIRPRGGAHASRVPVWASRPNLFTFDRPSPRLREVGPALRSFSVGGWLKKYPVSLTLCAL
jgi:hypothetical protein